MVRERKAQFTEIFVVVVPFYLGIPKKRTDVDGKVVCGKWNEGSGIESIS